MSQRLVITPEAFDSVTPEEVGGKAWNLLQRRSRFDVPPFYIISTTAFRSVFDPIVLESPGQTPESIIRKFRDRLAESGIPEDLSRAIGSAQQACLGRSTPVAVRSSAVAEDGDSFSFAGIYETRLGVVGSDAVEDALLAVWNAAFSPRALIYRHAHGFDPCDTSIAVIVQQMAECTASGVCFTADPLRGDGRHLLVSAVFGLGEGLVSRGFAADEYRLCRETLRASSRIARKPQRLAWDPELATVRSLDVPAEMQDRPVLAGQELTRVARMALELEEISGRPQDVEFGFVGERLVLLQTRPLTATGALNTIGPSASNGDRLVWDNSNIIESYSGVTTPMTFSFIRHAYSIVYRCFSEVMGISPRRIRENDELYRNMLGFFRGRVYYNLGSWYRLVRMFPGYGYNREFLESMMGVKKSLVQEAPSTPTGFWRRWFVELPSLLRLFARSGWNFLRIKRIVRSFEDQFRRRYDAWSQLDFDEIPAQEVMRLYQGMEREMLWNWKAPIINDFYVMVFFGVLRRLCVAWCGDETGALHHGLISGEGGLQSDQPARMLIRISEEAEADPELRRLILERPPESLPSMIESDPRFASFHAMIADFIREYGFRCTNELKLESFSYQDQPFRLYQVLQQHLSRREDRRGTIAGDRVREQSVRRDAEAEAERRLAAISGWMPRRMIFHWVLGNVRQGIRQRENMRFARTKIYGLLRRILRAVGGQLAAEKVIDDREDIFYLTLDEVWDYLKGTSVNVDLKGLIRVRRSEFDEYRRGGPEPPDRFETEGWPYRSCSQDTWSAGRADEVGAEIRGTGCCPGTVSGEVEVVLDPEQATTWRGTILVAARTDPGWVVFYPAFDGILVERGSPLSHSVIVAREMGIPIIVGIDGLTRRLRSGQRVRMDGRRGTVELLDDL